jgi:putative membrane protein
VGGWLKRWIFNIVGILLTAYVIKGFDVTLLGAIYGSLTLGIINAIIRPVIIFLTIPINILTLGIFTLVINGLMLWLTSTVVTGFEITGFGTAILSALALSVISFLISFIIKD